MRIPSALALLPLPLFLGHGAPSDTDPPDVVVVVLDDVALSDADRIDTPALDWLADHGVAFRRAYSMPFCNPTRYTLLFGEYRGLDNGRVCGPKGKNTPRASRTSLADMMRGRGYRTALFGKWHVGTNPRGPWQRAPEVHGFDHWLAGSPENVNSCNSTDYWDWLRVDDGVVRRSKRYHTSAVLDAFRAWWLDSDGPRFALVSLQAAHAPMHRPPRDLLPQGYPPTRTGRERYEAMVTSTDMALGRIIEHIDLKRTLLVVVGDNGTPPNVRRPDQPKGKVKGSTFEDGVNIPLLFAGPGIGRGLETQALAHVVDLMGTLAELVGASYPADEAEDTRSLAPCLTDPVAWVRRSVYCDMNPGKFTPGQPPRLRDQAVIGTRFKLRQHGSKQTLYDLHEDPRERRPLDPDDPELAVVVEGLRADLGRQ